MTANTKNIERSQHDNKRLVVSLLKLIDARYCNHNWSQCEQIAVYKISLREEFKEFNVLWADKECCLDCMIDYLNQDYYCKYCDLQQENPFVSMKSLNSHEVSKHHREFRK